MPKRFLTKRDIDEYADCGLHEIEIDDNTVVTALGRDRARDLGISFVRTGTAAAAPPASDLHSQVRAAVIANLGGTPQNLDAIITRVLDGLNL